MGCPTPRESPGPHSENTDLEKCMAAFNTGEGPSCPGQMAFCSKSEDILTDTPALSNPVGPVGEGCMGTPSFPCPHSLLFRRWCRGRQGIIASGFGNRGHSPVVPDSWEVVESSLGHTPWKMTDSPHFQPCLWSHHLFIFIDVTDLSHSWENWDLGCPSNLKKEKGVPRPKSSDRELLWGFKSIEQLMLISEAISHFKSSP